MKLNFLLITVILLTFGSTIKAQTTPTLNWAQAVGSTSQEAGFTVITDSNGDIIVSGIFNGTLDFDPGPGIAERTAPSPAYSAFIAKYSSAGEFIWVNEFLSTYSISLEELTVDESNNVYAAGQFYTDVDLLPGTGTNIVTTPSYQSILVKMNAAGNVVFTYTTETTIGHSSINNLAVNSANEVYLTTYQYGAVDYDNGAGSQIVDNWVSGSFYYLVKLNQDGSLNWVKEVEPEMYDMAIDSSDNLVITGLFYNSTIDIAPGAPVVNISKTTSGDIFIFTVDGDGIYQSHFILGNNFYMYINNLTIDSSTQDILFSGTFNGTSNFEPSTMDHVLSTSGGLQELFVARFTNNGICKWARQSQGDPSASYLEDNDIQTDNQGNVFVCGSVNGTYDVDPGSGTSYVTNGNADNFIFKWDSSGNFNWAYELIESGELKGIAVSNDGNYLHMTGSNNVVTDIDPEGTTSIPVVGGNDFFVIKWNNCDMDVTIFNNGNALEAVEQSAGTTYQWYDPAGNPISGATNSTYKPTENGDHQVLITKGACSYFSNMYSITNAGLESEIDKSQLLLYPNPAENNFTISGITKTATIEILDMLGNRIYYSENVSSSDVIHVENLSSGHYVVRVSENDATSILSLIKA